MSLIMKFSLVMAIVADFLFFAASAQDYLVLETPGYVVMIFGSCKEGEVACDRFVYVGFSKRSKIYIILPGETLYRPCADGVTPCQVLGWRFLSGDFVYNVYDDFDEGVLEVWKGEKIILREKGRWKRR